MEKGLIRQKIDKSKPIIIDIHQLLIDKEKLDLISVHYAFVTKMSNRKNDPDHRKQYWYGALKDVEMIIEILGIKDYVEKNYV